MSEVRLGLVGLGGVGAVHFENLSRGDVKDGRLVAVCELKTGLADEKAGAAGAKAFYDYRELLDVHPGRRDPAKQQRRTYRE